LSGFNHTSTGVGIVAPSIVTFLFLFFYTGNIAMWVVMWVPYLNCAADMWPPAKCCCVVVSTQVLYPVNSLMWISDQKLVILI